jgi:ABC-type branched-subunit amino acid transport system ATPase component
MVNASITTSAASAPSDARLGVHVADVTRRFGDVVAVEGLSLAVAPGEIVAVVGP